MKSDIAFKAKLEVDSDWRQVLKKSKRRQPVKGEKILKF
jgi:hypothetical protein